MKQFRKTASLWLLASVITAMTCAPVVAVEDAIIAIVNDDVITLKDLKDYINAVYTQLKMESSYSNDQIQELMVQVQQEGITRLIEDRLLLNAATEMGIEARREVVDEKIGDIKKRYPSEKEFLDSLAIDGLTLTDVRQRISDQLKTKFFVETQIKPNIQVNPQDITDFYTQNPEKFKNPEQADVSSLFVPFSESQEKTRETANQVYGMLKMGNSFEDAAERFSLIPSRSTIIRGQMKPNIEKQIFQLKNGEISWPIESDRGFFLFKMHKRFPEKRADLDEVKDQIAAFLFNEKYREKLNEWLENAKQKTYIEIKSYVPAETGRADR